MSPTTLVDILDCWSYELSGVVMGSGTEKRVAVVTGSSRGIGRATALRLAADGVAVVVNSRADSAASEQVVGAIRSQGGRSRSHLADVADPAGLVSLFDEAERHF